MTESNNIKIEDSWKEQLLPEFQKPYFQQVRAFLVEEINKQHQIYPPLPLIFEAFNQCPFSKTKVVILGQDPYHGPGQAHGLSFSVNKDIPIPPSLKNIYKETEQDLDIPAPNHGYLVSWAEQGVLLLNSTLTVQKKTPASHSGQGWEIFTDKVIETISHEKSHVVFLLWGKFAQSKASLIDTNKHLVLTAAHPSPFSAHNGFFGCRHFSKTNEYLSAHNQEPINWHVPQ